MIGYWLLISGWATFVNSASKEWLTLNYDWVVNFSHPLHLVLYDVMQKDLIHHIEDITQFINISTTPRDIWCAVDSQEGSHHRKGKPMSHSLRLFPVEMKNVIEKNARILSEAIHKRFPSLEFHTLMKITPYNPHTTREAMEGSPGYGTSP